jgi:hypothetical protein
MVGTVLGSVTWRAAAQRFLVMEARGGVVREGVVLEREEIVLWW